MSACKSPRHGIVGEGCLEKMTSEIQRYLRAKILQDIQHKPQLRSFKWYIKLRSLIMCKCFRYWNSISSVKDGRL